MRLLALMIAWRSGRRARRPILRLFPAIAVAVIILVTSGVASIFSSNVIRETLNQVLLKGSRCRFFYSNNVQDPFEIFTRYLPYQTGRANKFLNYRIQCYTEETHTDGCNLYIKPRLPLVSTRSIACPFRADTCKLEEDNLIIDTGMLDSLEHFGINTAREYQFQLRLVTTCAPLKTQGYISNFNDSDYSTVKRYMYSSVESPNQINNFTYELPVNHIYIPNENVSTQNYPRLEYQLGSISHYAGINDDNL
jgi:hypothetical protein